jgi:hypothetical protein
VSASQHTAIAGALIFLDLLIRLSKYQHHLPLNIYNTYTENGQIESLLSFSMFQFVVLCQLCLCFEFLVAYITFEFLLAKEIEFHTSCIVRIYKKLYLLTHFTILVEILYQKRLGFHPPYLYISYYKLNPF